MFQHIKGGDDLECPVCGKYNFAEENSFDICPICGWENDGVQADDHNYAGGANPLSVNEARIEFFLLGKKNVRETVMRRRQEFEEEYHGIQKRYAGLDYAKSPEKAKQREEDFNKARKRYLDILNRILQNIICDDMQSSIKTVQPAGNQN